MKVLWLCNIILPKISKKLNKRTINEGGWLVGLSNGLSKKNDIELTICFPALDENQLNKGKVENINYYGIPINRKEITKYNEKNVKIFSNIIKEVKPDIINIFGTEYPHTLEMVKACESLNIIKKVVISIQGLCSVYAKHYTANLPHEVCKGKKFVEIIKKRSIYKERDEFIRRGTYEVEAIKKVNNVIGRTSWDKACTTQINPNINYYFCNEILRDEFYKYEWNIENCEKYSIFVSQGSYPIKGLHNVLEALSIVKEKYPNFKLYVAGDIILRGDSFKERLRESSYPSYLKDLIKKYNLQNNIVFTSNLDEKSMCERFLKSHVFVSASSIENSPNSLGEAMILGVPCITSYVGGVGDMIEHEREGFIYQSDAPYMLAYYICEIFENNDKAIMFSKNARERAKVTHNKEININQTIKIYNKIKEQL